MSMSHKLIIDKFNESKSSLLYKFDDLRILTSNMYAVLNNPSLPENSHDMCLFREIRDFFKYLEDQQQNDKCELYYNCLVELKANDDEFLKYVRKILASPEGLEFREFRKSKEQVKKEEKQAEEEAETLTRQYYRSHQPRDDVKYSLFKSKIFSAEEITGNPLNEDQIKMIAYLVNCKDKSKIKFEKLARAFVEPKQAQRILKLFFTEDMYFAEKAKYKDIPKYIKYVNEGRYIISDEIIKSDNFSACTCIIIKGDRASALFHYSPEARKPIFPSLADLKDGCGDLKHAVFVLGSENSSSPEPQKFLNQLGLTATIIRTEQIQFCVQYNPATGEIITGPMIVYGYNPEPEQALFCKWLNVFPQSQPAMEAEKGFDVKLKSDDDINDESKFLPSKDEFRL